MNGVNLTKYFMAEPESAVTEPLWRISQHVPSTTKCEITNVRANLKRKATTTQETAQQILGAELTGERFLLFDSGVGDVNPMFIMTPPPPPPFSIMNFAIRII